MAMAVRGKKTAAMPPEQRPDLFAIRLREPERIERGPGEKLEPSLAMRRRRGGQARFDLEEKHQPVRLSGVAVFADDPGEVQVGGMEVKPHFFAGFAAGAGMG